MLRARGSKARPAMMTSSTGTGGVRVPSERRAAGAGPSRPAWIARPPRPCAARGGWCARRSGALLLLAVSGCVKVGPDFVPPEAPVSQAWLTANDPRIVTTAPEDPAWWRRFDDAKLSNLIRIAQQQNPNVQVAGVRVLQAGAQLSATIGDLYPQKQQLSGELTYKRLSNHNSPTDSTATWRETCRC